MKKKIIKAQNISITKCTNSLVLLVLDGQCSVLKFNKIKNYQKQDVIFIEKDDIYALKGNCILAIIELEKNEIKDTELVDALDSMDLKKMYPIPTETASSSKTCSVFLIMTNTSKK